MANAKICDQCGKVGRTGPIDQTSRWLNIVGPVRGTARDFCSQECIRDHVAGAIEREAADQAAWEKRQREEEERETKA